MGIVALLDPANSSSLGEERRAASFSPGKEPVRPLPSGIQGPVVPDHRALSRPPGIEAKPLGCPGAVPEDVHGAVGAPLPDGQRRLVPEARALSHYSGDTFLEKAENSNLNRRPDRMPVYGAGLTEKPRARPWSLRAKTPGNSHCAPSVCGAGGVVHEVIT